MYKKINGDSTPLIQKERCPKKAPRKSLFWEHLCWSLTVATPLRMSRAKLHVRLKWPIIYHCLCMVLHDIVVCLFIYVLRYWMRFCCFYCLIRAFPNCYSVCHQNNKYVCTPFNKQCGGSNHGSPVFIRFKYPVANSPTHSLRSLDHFLLTVKDRPCHSDQHNVHYITSWEV